MPTLDVRTELAQARDTFRRRLEQAGASSVWDNFHGRIAAVLSGGGARGAYEAGALVAFQDAGLPTHIVTATSVGSINAASYAAHSDTLVGSAESLVEGWFDLTPPAAGIEWTRYVWMLAGLIAASAGFGNLINDFLSERGFRVSLQDPALTWFMLGLAGTAVLLLYDRLPYLGYLIRNYFRRTSWKPDRRKAVLSLVANLIVWGFLMVVALQFEPKQFLVLLGVLLSLFVLYRLLRAPLGLLLHGLLRLPLRAGLFASFERGRLLRQRLSVERLLASPIRLIITATDLETGTARFFSNRPVEEIAADPGADPHFVREEVSTAEDIIRTVIASSALPIAYEPITLSGRTYTDGGIVANQPIRPAIRLGADVLFLVMMDPPEGRRRAVKTFIDVGLRALDILMLQNLLTDLRMLNNINAVCERAAGELGVNPEEVEIDLGTRRYRYVKAFTIRPATSLGGTVLDFDGATTGPAIVQGYRDASVQIEHFLAYARTSRFGRPKRVLRFAPEPAPQLDPSRLS
ncbi:MAG: patatin-like phospholipase family protein [Acidobacteria bacterium]|nr:patatin-like phospholipase family protein [Acidobacteriota bacterium]